MALIDLISKEIVKVPLTGTSKTEIIRELIQVMKAAGRIDDAERVYNTIMEREAKGSTGLELGIAVPHAKTEAVDNLTIVIGISPEGVDFDALDGELSKIFFLMLAPPDQSGPHIEALSEIARLARSSVFLRTLAGSKTPEEVVELLTED